MDLEELRKICLSFPKVTEDMKWENHLCFCIGEKMFLVTGPDQVPVTASLKVSDEEFENLSSKPGCKPAPYLARYKWIYMDNIERLSKKQWEKYAKEAYQLIAAKLPAKTKKELGIK